MKYVNPQITGSFRAVSTIQSDKFSGPAEINPLLVTNGAGYQADE